MLDRLSQPRGPDAARGGLYAVDPWAGSVDTLLAVADHPELRFPTGLAYGRTDELLLVDKDANPMGYPGRPGAVYSFDLQSRTLRLLAASDKFVEPSDVILESTGSVLIVDYEADPSGTQPRSGCLFEIDPLSGAVTPVPHQAYTFVDPIGLAEGPLRRVYVVDISANPRALPQNTGAVFQVIREAGNLTVLLSADTLYADPTDILVEDSGRIIVSDRESDPFDFGPGDHGALLSFFPHSGPVSVYAGHGTLRGPEGLALFREGSLSVSSLDLADINGPPALPGDSLRFEVLVSNAGPARIESAMASLYVSDRLSLIAVEGSPGIGLDPRAGGLTWLGDLEPAETARVGGWARINDDLVFGERIFGYTRIAGPGAPAPDTAGLRGVTYLGPGDVVLVDLNADLGAGTARGTLFFLREGEGETTPIISADPSWFDPTAVEYEGPGRLLMADPSGAGGGRIFSVDYLNGTSRIWISDPRLGTPVDLCMTRGGDLLIVDQLASLQNPTGQRPAIFIKRAGQSGLSVFTDHPALAAPDQLAEDDLGRLWLVDSQADPNGLQHGSGALFRIDAQTGALADTLQFREFVRPTGVVVWPEAGLAVVDGRARQLGPIGTGVIFQVDPDRETLGVRIEDPRFRLPRNAAFTLGGDLWIVDAIARDDALPGAPGTLFSYSPESGEIKTVAQSPDYVTPADLYIVPGPTPRFYSYDVEDLDGPPVEPGDEVRVTARIGNSGPVETRGVAYTDTLPAWVVLDPETIRYEAGTLQLLPELGVIVWNVDLGSETSYTITYEGRVRPEAPQGLEILFRSHLRTAEGVHRVRKASKRLPVFFEEEYLYLVDSDCDPFRFGKTVGALWKIHLRTGNTVTMASSESMVEPVACLMMPSSPPELFIVDELANPRGHAVGRGALWRLLPLESAIEVVSAEPTFRNPLTAIPIGDHELLLLDGLANPFNLPARFGPGAIYHVDTLTRETTPYHSDTLFVSPKDILLDGRGGLLVIDAEADPGGYGFRGGAVFRLDLIRKQVTVYSASADFRGPVAATIGPDGALYVLDRDAVAFEGTIARGVVWRIDRMGNAALFTASQFFRRPVDLAFDSSGNLMVSDEIADPAGYGEQHGAVFRRRGSSPSFDVFLASKRTASPAGFFIREGLTPLGLSDLEAEAADEGILLRWRVGEGQFDGFVILRASGSDPADEDYAPLNLDRLVPGMGPYEYLDEEIEPGTAYAYKIAAVLPGGGSRLYGPVHAVATAGRPFALHAAAPNPTRGSTSIRYSLPRKGDVRLQVFDLAGRRVRVLHDGPAGGGTKVLVWDGTNEQGRAVASGVYFLRLTWRDRSASGRVVLLR
ncbi:MAG: T9SS type A sorting domain-containing protein [Candidatus Eisenbacteria bacterium]|nr:T9SS type A sorting domain-containing protein [Candidatus Eisenbacteria bacterium]